MECFESPKLLIARAHENYADFTAKRNEFFDIKSRTQVLREVDEVTGEEVYFVQFIGPIPGNVRTAASDVLNNARHALDQAVHSSLSALCPAQKVGSSYFPIGKREADFEGSMKGKCKGVNSAVLDIIRKAKPYMSGDGPFWDLLRMAGPNKHQVVLGADANIKIKQNSFYLEAGFGNFGDVIRRGDKPEWEVARMVPGSIISMNFEIDIFLSSKKARL